MPAQTDRNSPWNVTDDDFPFAGSAEDKWRYLLRFAILAPSTRNTQPWDFRLNSDALDLYLDRRREIPAIDPRDRELVMSCGAALFLLRVAMEHFDCPGQVTLFPPLGDDDLLARIKLTGGDTSRLMGELDPLFPAIPRRHTQRRPFDDYRLPASLVAQLRRDARQEGATLRVITDDAQRQTIAALVAEGDRNQAASPSFRRQLASQLHSNLGLSRDGIPGYALGLGWLGSLLLPRLIGKGGWAEDAALDHSLAVTTAPLLAVLTTAGDSTRDWLMAGQALARVLLRATLAEVAASFLGPATEVPALRMQLRRQLGGRVRPQLILRMGYAEAAQPTPRRRVSEVLHRSRS